MISGIFPCQQIRISIIIHNDCIVFHLLMFCTTFCKHFLLHIYVVSVRFSPTLHCVLSPITLLRIYFEYSPCKNPKLFSNFPLIATFLCSESNYLAVHTTRALRVTVSPHKSRGNTRETDGRNIFQ